jgi:hypothetical protein
VIHNSVADWIFFCSASSKGNLSFSRTDENQPASEIWRADLFVT